MACMACMTWHDKILCAAVTFAQVSSMQNHKPMLSTLAPTDISIWSGLRDRASVPEAERVAAEPEGWIGDWSLFDPSSLLRCP